MVRQMKTTDSSALCPNVRASDGNGISMDAKRADRFTSVMHRIYRLNHSLNAAAGTFLRRDLDEGEMDPASTVRAFTKPLDDEIQTLFRMIENDDPPQVGQEGGAQ